jgi:hypothetical protein
MGICWPASAGLVSRPNAVTKPDADVCPICLEQNAPGLKEVCENGHGMHRECARQMSRHMKLRCPFCRSKLVCTDCKSCKTSIICNCNKISSKPENIWGPLQHICQTHICISIAIFLFPFFSPAALVVGILLNFSSMLRRIVKSQRESEKIKKLGAVLRVAIKITQIGMEIFSFGLILIAAAVITIHSDILNSLIPRK